MTHLAICGAFVLFMVCSSSQVPEVHTCSGDSCEEDIVATQLLQTKLLKISAAQQRQNSEDDALMHDDANSTACPYCFCSITSALKCGTDAVESAALCGTSSVTDGAKCGFDSVQNIQQCGSDSVQFCSLLQTDSKMEGEDEAEQEEKIESQEEEKEEVNQDEDDHHKVEADHEQGENNQNAREDSRQLLSARDGGRRRKGGVFKKVKKSVKKATTVCRWENVAKKCSVAKSCAVPNKCDMPKTCDVTSSLGSCLASLKNFLPSSIRNYVQMVADSGCTSASSCKSAVESGLQDIQESISDEMQNGISGIAKNLVDAMPFSPSTVIPTLVNCISSQASAIAHEAVEAGQEIDAYFSATDFTFQKWDFKDFCTGEGEGLWYMEPTDCGAFDAMATLFTGGIGDSLGNYAQVAAKLKTCATNTGMFGFPTPFMDFKIQSYCLPSFLVLPLEYIVGGIVYAENAGANSMLALVTTISDKLCFLLENAGIDLQQVGTLIQEKQIEKLGLMQKDADAINNWSVHLGLQLDIEVMIPTGQYLSVSFGFKLLAGKISGKVAVPNLAMFMSLGAGILGAPKTPPEKVLPQTGVTISFGFAKAAPTYVNRGSVSAEFDIVPKVDLAGIGIPAEAGLPISFKVLPSIDTPKGFSIELSVSTSLLEMGKDIKAQVAAKSRLAYEKGEDSVQTAIHHAIHHLATDSRLDRAFESASLDSKKIVDTMVAADADHAGVVKEAMEHKIAAEKAEADRWRKGMSALEEEPSRQDPSPLNVATQAGVSFEVCLTPDIGDVSPCDGASISDLSSTVATPSIISCVMNFISGGGSSNGGGCR